MNRYPSNSSLQGLPHILNLKEKAFFLGGVTGMKNYGEKNYRLKQKMWKRNRESRNTKDFWKCKSNFKKLIFTGEVVTESCSLRIRVKIRFPKQYVCFGERRGENSLWY